MTYYLERFMPGLGTEVIALKADSDSEAIETARRLHEPRYPASGGILWDHAHVAVATLGRSDEGLGNTRIDRVKVQPQKPMYYGNLFDYMDGDI